MSLKSAKLGPMGIALTFTTRPGVLTLPFSVSLACSILDSLVRTEGVTEAERDRLIKQIEVRIATRAQA